MAYVPELKKKYQDDVIPALMKNFGYRSVMQVPRLEKIVLNQGVGQAVADKKLVDVAQEELTLIAGQKAVQTASKKDRKIPYTFVGVRSLTCPHRPSTTNTLRRATVSEPPEIIANHRRDEACLVHFYTL